MCMLTTERVLERVEMIVSITDVCGWYCTVGSNKLFAEWQCDWIQG